MVKPKKRGISPLIATVLLIGFAVAIVLLVFLWGKNYVEELAAKRGALAQKQHECQLVKINARSACRSATEARIVLENMADKQVDKFIFRRPNVETGEPTEDLTPLGSLEVAEYKITFGTGGIDRVEVIPSLKAGRNKYVPCTDQSLTVRLNTCN